MYIRIRPNYILLVLYNKWIVESQRTRKNLMFYHRGKNFNDHPNELRFAVQYLTSIYICILLVMPSSRLTSVFHMFGPICPLLARYDRHPGCPIWLSTSGSLDVFTTWFQTQLYKLNKDLVWLYNFYVAWFGLARFSIIQQSIHNKTEPTTVNRSRS